MLGFIVVFAYVPRRHTVDMLRMVFGVEMKTMATGSGYMTSLSR